MRRLMYVTSLSSSKVRLAWSTGWCEAEVRVRVRVRVGVRVRVRVRGEGAG